MDKHSIITALLAHLRESLNNAQEAAKQAHDLATHEQSKAETQYDTVAIEAAFLAEGQSKRIAELQLAIQDWQTLTTKPFNDQSDVTAGAFLTLEDDSQTQSHYLLGNHAGGTKLVVNDTIVKVITLSSPLGQRLHNQTLGDEIAHPVQTGQILEIIALK